MWSQTKLQEIKLDLLNKWPFPGEKGMQRMLMLICPVPVAKVQGGKDRQAVWHKSILLDQRNQLNIWQTMTLHIALDIRGIQIRDRGDRKFHPYNNSLTWEFY